MEGLEAIFTRRSVRKFTGEVLSEADLNIILRAGFYAPSAMDRRPWHFIVVRNPETLAAFASGLRYGKMIPSAGCAIIVCGSRTVEPLTGFLIEDCSAAIQNMLLAAHSLGLGAVWCGLYPVPLYVRVIKQTVKLPREIVPVGLIAVGYKMEERQTPERFDPSRVHTDQW